jgi:hypothetical protein
MRRPAEVAATEAAQAARAAPRIHPGARALLMGAGLTIGGAAALALLALAYGPLMGPDLLWLAFLIGIVAVGFVLAGPAYVLLSAPAIFAWIALRFGANVLMTVVGLAALAMSALCAWWVAEEIAHASLHFAVIVALFSATGALWAFLGHLLRARPRPEGGG